MNVPLRWRTVIAAAALSAACTALAQAPDALDGRLRKLETELRCLVCQNQTLADSDAPLAVDLRREIRALAVAGRSDDEIRSFLVDRYSDFVLYMPPLKRTTLLLWLGPFALLAAGVVTWIVVLRGRRRAAVTTPTSPSPASTARAKELLDGRD